MGLAAAIVDELDRVGDWGLLATDAELRVTVWNRWLEQRSGLAAAAVIGRPLFEVFPELTTRRLDRYYRQALGGQTVLLSQQFHKYVVPLPVGPTEAGLDRMQQTTRIVPMVDGGTVRGTLTVLEDVTERVAYESKLRSLARQKEAVAALARSALAGSDVSDVAAEVIGHLVEALGTDFAEVLELQPDGETWAMLAGMGWDEKAVRVFGPGPVPRAAPAVRSGTPATADAATPDPWLGSDAHLRAHGVATGLVVRIPGRGQIPFGLIGVYLQSARPFTADQVQFVQALADVLGVAIERTRLEAELRVHALDLAEADRRKDEFLATLAHELRNPLAPIRNALEIMRLTGGLSAPVERARELVDRQVGQLVRLVDDLMDVSRITRGKIELRREQTDLGGVIRAAVEISRPLVEAARHELTVALPADPVWVDGDPDRLAQVVANLLNNAAKYTDPGGSVRVSAAVEAGEAVVRVRDTGVGIPAAMLPRVFDLFAQVDQSLSRSQGGLGIGLSLVRSLVELHGGRVEVRSEGPGRGSEFVVRLPLNAPDPGPQSVPTRPVATRPAAASRRRVLVIEDNVDGAETLRVLLELVGHEVTTASDGQAGLAAARRIRPDVVICDIGLPGMDGLAVARALRTDPATAAARLVSMSGYGQEEDRKQAREAGFDEVLIKPVVPELVLGIIASSTRVTNHD